MSTAKLVSYFKSIREDKSRHRKNERVRTTTSETNKSTTINEKSRRGIIYKAGGWEGLWHFLRGRGRRRRWSESGEESVRDMAIKEGKKVSFFNRKGCGEEMANNDIERISRDDRSSHSISSGILPSLGASHSQRKIKLRRCIISPLDAHYRSISPFLRIPFVCVGLLCATLASIHHLVVKYENLLTFLFSFWVLG